MRTIPVTEFSDLPNRQFPRAFALIASLGVVLLGSLALAGWVLHLETLKRIIPGADPIKPNMATAMVLCGAALSLLSRKTLTKSVRIWAAAMAVTVIILSALTIGEYLFDCDLGIEHWLIGDMPANPEIPHPGRMAPITAVCFILVGVALFTASRQIQKRLRLPLVGALGGTLTAAGAVPLTGFLLEILFGPNWNYMGVTSSGLPGAVAFLFLGIGLLELLRSKAHLTWALDKLTTAGVASGFTLMILAAGLTYNFTAKMQHAATQVGHAQEIRRELNETEDNLLELEHEQRSYIITGNERLLDGWDAKESEIRDHLQKLQQLEVDDSRQQKVLRQLAVLVSQRINRVKQTAEIRRERSLPAAQEMIATGAGDVLREQSRGLVEAIESDGDARLRKLQTQSDQASRKVFLMLPLGVFVCFAILTLGVFFLNSGTGERERAEKALREAEKKYRGIFENAVEGIFQTTPDGRFISANFALARLFGFDSPEELIAARTDIAQENYVDPKTRDEFKRLLNENGSVLDFELAAIRKDGSRIWLSENVLAVRDDAGTLLYYEGTAQDITKRKHAEGALRASEEKFRQLADHITDVFWMTTHDMQQIDYVSPAYEKVWGRSRESLLADATQWVKAVLPEDRKQVFSAFAGLGEGKSSVSIEYRISRPDGAIRWLHDRGFVVRDAAGTAIRHAGIATDITERKQLETQREQLAAIVEASPDFIGFADSKTAQIQYINKHGRRMCGIGKDEDVGKLKISDVHPDWMNKRLTEIVLPVALRDGLWEGEGAFLHRNGREIPVLMSLLARNGADGKVDIVYTISRDITDRKKAEELVRASEERYRNLFESNPSPMWVYDLETLFFLAVNAAAVELYGYSREEFLEITIRDIRPEEDVPALNEASKVSAVREKGEQSRHRGIWRHRKKNGEILFADIYTTNIQFEGRAAHLAIAIDVTEKKKAEDAIRESEERMRAVLESALDCVITMDDRGRIVEFNPAAELTFGYKRDEVIGQLLANLIIPPLLRERHQRGLTRYLSTGEASALGKRVELTGMRSDKSEFPIELAITRIGSQEPPMFTGFIRDITERKDAEKHLAQMEGRYRGLLEAAPDAMVVVNQRGEIVLLNLQAEKQFGYRRDELVGQKVKNIIPDGFAERLVADDLRSAEDALAQQIGTGIELTGRRKNGSDFPIEMILSPLESADGILVTAAIRDITERKRAEQKLLEQANLLNLAQDAIVVRGMDDRIEFWNRGAEHLYGWSAEEVCDQPSCDFLDYEEPVKILAERALLQTGAWTGECRHLTKQGDTVTVRSRWTLVRDEDGQPKAKLIIMTDVTEQKKLETHLLRAQRLESIGTLASGVAHDLNNILTPILMCTEVLKGNPAQKELPALVSMIEESARRGASVVKQVLTFARGIEGDRVVIKPSHLIQEMVDIARKTFPKTIEIIGRYPTDLSSIEADPTQLHQVLLNLSVNARDAMVNGGTLTLAADNFNVDENYASMMPGAKPGPHVMFRVTDTGCGMPRAMIDKIFDPFFTTKEVGKGTGLGLSTTLGIVKSHGGFISVYSEPTKGTTFKLFLPATATPEGLPPSSTSIATTQGKGELILVVDDEPNILGVTKMILEKHSYDVVSASDGPEALAIFAQQMKSISLVLTDLSMPYMDGIALVRSLKKMQPDVSILASTGQGEQASVAELQSLGVKNFLTKPYNTDRLLAALDDTLHHRESESSKVKTTQVG